MLRAVKLIVGNDREGQTPLELELPVVGATGVYREAGHEWSVEVEEIRLRRGGFELRFRKLKTLHANPGLPPVRNGRTFGVTNAYGYNDKGWWFGHEKEGELPESLSGSRATRAVLRGLTRSELCEVAGLVRGRDCRLPLRYEIEHDLFGVDPTAVLAAFGALNRRRLEALAGRVGAKSAGRSKVALIAALAAAMNVPPPDDVRSAPRRRHAPVGDSPSIVFLREAADVGAAISPATDGIHEAQRLLGRLLLLKWLSGQSAPASTPASALAPRPLAPPGLPDGARWERVERATHSGQAVRAAFHSVEEANPWMRGFFTNALMDTADDDRWSKLIGLLERVGVAGDGLTAPAAWELLQNANTRRAGAMADSLAKLVAAIVGEAADSLYDPSCGSGLLIGVGRILRGGIRLFGQEMTPDQWTETACAALIHGVVADLGPGPGDPAARDVHDGLRADAAVSLIAQKSKDSTEPAWLNRALDHVRPGGTAVLGMLPRFAFASGGAALARAALVQQDLVEAVIQLPSGLLANTQLPLLVMILSKGKHEACTKGHVLLCDARRYGCINGHGQGVLDPDDVAEIVGVWRNWRTGGGLSAGLDGLAVEVPAPVIAAHGFGLLPSGYLGT